MTKTLIIAITVLVSGTALADSSDEQKPSQMRTFADVEKQLELNSERNAPSGVRDEDELATETSGEDAYDGVGAKYAYP